MLLKIVEKEAVYIFRRRVTKKSFSKK